MAGGLMDLWNQWATQILVLLSLTLQIVLLLFAGIRRHEASPVLRPLLWLAYQLADSTAIYAVGHLALSSAPREHQLVAFWAPFLLLHLGGPDNITAYAIEDNKLWKRHFLTLVVQVLGVGYVLYEHIAGSGILVSLGAILMFVVGVVKYGERTWALRCANFSSIESSLKKHPRAKHRNFYPEVDEVFNVGEVDEELILLLAHSMFHICKRGIVDSVIDMDPDSHDTELLGRVRKEPDHMWALLEMELSLMYDILYTKAAVIHTCRGYCIRVLSPLATAAALLLFQFSAKDGHSRVDVAITYVLLGAAFLLETTSLLNALGSSWAFAFLSTTRWRWLRHTALCAGRWHQLRHVVVSLRQLVRFMGSSSYNRSRRWSGTMGQYNMLHFCSRNDKSTTRPLLSRLAKMLGYDEWWNRKHYSRTVVISQEVKMLLFGYIKRLLRKGEVNTMGVLRNKWGLEALQRRKLDERLSSTLGVELHEGILIWHIGTDILLARSKRAKEQDVKSHVDAIRALSNYMMFLLVDRPYMLPGLAQKWLYKRTCNNMVEIWGDHKEPSPNKSSNVSTMLQELFRLHDGPNSSTLPRIEELASILYKVVPGFSVERPRLSYAKKIARVLVDEESDTIESLKVVLEVWANILVYAANRCSRESHVKKLNSGAELTTIVWLMAEHLHQHQLIEKNQEV